MRAYWSILLCVISITCFSGEPSETSERDWSKHTLHYWYEDEPRSVAELVSVANWQPSLDGWIRKSKLSLNYWLDYSRERLWVKIQLDPTLVSREQNLWIDIHASGASNATLFYKKQGEFIEIDGSAANREASNGIPIRNLAFEVKKDFEQEIIYVLIESPIKFDVQINHFTESEFFAENQSSLFFFAFLYGLLIVMVLYNAIIGKYLEEPIYHYYAWSTFFATSHQFLAHGHLRLFAIVDWDIVILLMIVTALVTLAIIGLFIRSLLSLSRYTPKADKFLLGYIKVLTAATLISLVIPLHWALFLCLVLGAPSSTFALVFSYNAHLKGSPLAKAFLISWSVYFVGATLWIAYWMGLVPLTAIVEQSFLLGMSIEAVLLSMVLAYRIQVLKNQRQELLASQSQLQELSYIDSLAGIGNRRAFDQKINQLFASNKTVGLALADVDHFKNYNDTWGHAEGDTVIRRLGELLFELFGDKYSVYRIGGEEFAILFEATGKDEIQESVEQLRHKFSQLKFAVGNNQAVHCTLSVGFDNRLPEESVTSLFKRVDDALYRAKDAGRNRSCSGEDGNRTASTSPVSTIV